MGGFIVRMARRAAGVFAAATVAVVVGVGLAGAASSDPDPVLACPAGARGGSGGDAGVSQGGAGGLGFTVGSGGTGLADGGFASANGGNAGSARGGDGGRGGTGFIPVCNQNTNGDAVGDDGGAAPATSSGNSEADALVRDTFLDLRDTLGLSPGQTIFNFIADL